MSKQNNRIVYKTKDGDWAVKKSGNEKASSLHRTQKAASETARIMLKNQGGGELITKGIDGKIRSKDTVRIPATYHVYQDVEEKWSVKKSGSNRAIKSFNNRNDAIQFAKHLSKIDQDEIVIHSQNGRIISKASFAKDPNPPKDKS